MKPRFHITYEIITPGSCRHGDFKYHGYMPRSLNEAPRRNHLPDTPAKFTLRQAVDFMLSHGGHIEADECPVSNPRWFTVYPDANVYGDPSDTTYSVHVGSFSDPVRISRASRMRIARLLNCYGLTPAKV